MKAKLILFAVVVLLAGVGIVWIPTRHQFIAGTANSGRKPLYYTCAMHPWVRENAPGPCPVCGMNLTPIYADENSGAQMDSNAIAGEVTIGSESISAINVQTASVERRPLRHTIHLSGQIAGNSRQAAWFEFTAYQRDLEWLKTGQALEVIVAGIPDKVFTAQIKAHGTKPFADENFDMMTSSTTVRAEISDPPVQIGDFGKYKYFNGLHAEAHLVAETEPALTIPRSAIISRGFGAMVYVDKGRGHYAPRAIEPGRIGDEFAEVLNGLAEGDKVVTNGSVLIDSEAQITSGE